MPEPVHVLVVKAGGLLWALPMASVEQTFALGGQRIHRIGSTNVVLFRGRTLELVHVADALGAGDRSAAPVAAVAVWAGGRRRAFGVDELVGQMVLERLDVPALARGRYCAGVALLDSGEVVPILEPGAVAGGWNVAGESSFGFTELQRSALIEIANIGSGNAATALSQLLGRPVDIRYAEAVLATLAEAADRVGAAAERSAMVDTPVAGDGGKVILVFPDEAAGELCSLLGTSLDDELGRSALREIGNILASSYLNAIVQMTGLSLEPEPPEVEIDVLGSLVERRLSDGAKPDDPAVLMRSVMTVESSNARFAFLFIPQIGSIGTLLDALGVGEAAAA